MELTWYQKLAMCFVVFMAFMCVYRFIIIPIKYNSVEDHECIATVTDKERHEDGYYLIFCTDLNGNTIVFKNDDTVIRGKFDSSDMYQQIVENKTYKFHLNGYRNDYWSLYENILSFEEYAVSESDSYETTEETDILDDDSKSEDIEETKLTIIPEVTEVTESPYSVYIEFDSMDGIAIKKLYKPEVSNELDVADEITIRDTIIANGTDIFGTSFEVYENGVYWIYIQEISGKEHTQRFIIENIN